jgi:hypothetical protein
MSCSALNAADGSIKLIAVFLSGVKFGFIYMLSELSRQ